jgi:hypothetical protein
MQKLYLVPAFFLPSFLPPPSITVVSAPAETEASNPISFTPRRNAWSTIAFEDPDFNKSTCKGSLNPHRRATNVLNVTISFNYTGVSDFTPC